MSSKRGGPNSDYEYLRAAIVQEEHTSLEYDVVVASTISMRRSPYCLVYRIEGYAKEYPETAAPICAYEATWPNVQVIGWCAFLFQCAVKFDQLVEDSRRDTAKAFASFE
jgi:hypothetical protein